VSETHLTRFSTPLTITGAQYNNVQQKILLSEIKIFNLTTMTGRNENRKRVSDGFQRTLWIVVVFLVAYIYILLYVLCKNVWSLYNIYIYIYAATRIRHSVTPIHCATTCRHVSYKYRLPFSKPFCCRLTRDGFYVLLYISGFLVYLN